MRSCPFWVSAGTLRKAVPARVPVGAGVNVMSTGRFRARSFRVPVPVPVCIPVRRRSGSRPTFPTSCSDPRTVRPRLGGSDRAHGRCPAGCRQLQRRPPHAVRSRCAAPPTGAGDHSPLRFAFWFATCGTASLTLRGGPRTQWARVGPLPGGTARSGGGGWASSGMDSAPETRFGLTLFPTRSRRSIRPGSRWTTPALEHC